MFATLPLEPMSYKQQTKTSTSQELLTKLRIVRASKRENKNNLQIATQYQCHRNTVSNILRNFQNQFSSEMKHSLIFEDDWRKEELIEALICFKNASRRPHSHPHQAPQEQLEKVVELFEEKKMRVGVKRLQGLMKRRFYDSQDPVKKSLSQIKIGALRGIYNRAGLKLDKVKTGNGKRQPLYDYTKLGCFEYLHYDTKHVLDLKALPEDIYNMFAGNPELPLYQWTLQDAKSRFRFFAYSRSLNAEFGLKFLLFVLQYLRGILPGWKQHITVGMDNGVEFCCGSVAKEENWNDILNVLNASMYSYHAGHDIRKNLIERSHLSDDQELYVPRGIYMDTLPNFTKEARRYVYYFNFERGHSGIAMNDRTPFEVLTQSGICGANQLMKFPVVVLEDEIETLRNLTDQVLFQSELLQKHGSLSDNQQLNPKTFIDISSKYDFFDNPSAQNLLTYYHFTR